MNRYFFTLILLLLGGLSISQAQSREDSLLLTQLVSSSNLIAGNTYLVETDKRYSSPEFGKSQLLKEGETPVFDARGELVNGVPYAEFGNNPIVFNAVRADKVTIEIEEIKNGKAKVVRKKLEGYIASFTCGGLNYCAYTGSDSPSRATYDLIEADLLDKANELLVGKTLYTRTASWLDRTTNRAGRPDPQPAREGTFKYYPVTITRVVNDYDNMYLVFFEPRNKDGEYCFVNISLGGTGTNLFDYFSFENPQDGYPDIPQEHWELIMAQKVKQGFTPHEVRTAYGDPDETLTENENETWVYYNLNKKDYTVAFKDGVVDKVVSQTSTYYYRLW